ncbi:hypothetical protein CYLTODRAFT_451425 [Cylindrobasidium torrendii FP15055 ss-10]|uniref:Uncharacterized protein n=1 Tax=Cylindrobasidium torrendii FP15055 ss-10 TaxID=1314674 RepID=A0A0D7BKR2_9AGAR|nr:hypothetical protein CYLTODRAFT_451425 [Cylindrobasidium torrendii FP15055 ss-10]
MSATLIAAPVAMGLLVSHAPRCNCLTCRPCAVIDLREAQARAAAIKYYETRDSTHGQRSFKSVFKRISKTIRDERFDSRPTVVQVGLQKDLEDDVEVWVRLTANGASLKSVFKRISKTMSRSASPTPSVEEPPMGMGSFGSVYEALDDPFAA